MSPTPTQIASIAVGTGRSPATVSVTASLQAASPTQTRSPTARDTRAECHESHQQRTAAAAGRVAATPIGARHHLDDDVDVGAEPGDVLLDQLECLVEHRRLADGGADDVE